MAEYNDYNSSLTAQEIESVLLGSVVHNKAMNLNEAQKAQARENIGAGSADNSFVVLGYFATLEELQTAVPEPNAGPFYGVGETGAYDFYSWDELHSVWANNGPIKGVDGEQGVPGKDGKNAISFANIIVSDQAWVMAGDEAGYPYRAAIALPNSGVDESWTVDVQFENPSEILADRTLSYNGGFYIFAASPPESIVKILTAVCSQTEVKEFTNEVFATISVTYLEGKTVTCTDGATTLTAKTTSGSWEFGVPHAGEWVVSDGENSQTVSITTQGQSENVELKPAMLYLYNKGDECTDVTGGWTSKALGLSSSVPNGNNLTVTKNATYIKAAQSVGSKCGILYAKNKIDLTEYSTLHAKCRRSPDGSSSQVVLCAWTSIGTYAQENRAVTGYLPTELGEVSVDISALNGLHTIGFYVYHDVNYVELHEMWLT